MEEEINTLVSAGTLYKNNKNLRLSELWQTLRRKITNQTNCRSFFTDAESNSNESQTADDLEISEISTPTENDQSDNLKDSL